MIKIKRAYDPSDAADGTRILVDRLWPRGISKEALQIDAWRKEVAPSADLRRWFGHDPEKWEEFQRRYFDELDGRPEVWKPIQEAAQEGTVTLLYAARDTQHNNAVALQAFLADRK
jgi:uncharacterized protein YeaO (DUF488 family)